MFEGWDEYYLLVGSAGGALIGLLFVVATLNTGRDKGEALRGSQLYLTPVVFHLAVVMALSGLALAPRLPPAATAGLLGLTAAVGAGHSVFVTIGIRRTGMQPHWSDVWLYGVLPLVLYLFLIGTAVSVVAWPAAAPFLLAGGVLALLVCAIRNAWDLVTWLAPDAAHSDAHS